MTSPSREATRRDPALAAVGGWQDAVTSGRFADLEALLAGECEFRGRSGVAGSRSAAIELHAAELGDTEPTFEEAVVDHGSAFVPFRLVGCGTPEPRGVALLRLDGPAGRIAGVTLCYDQAEAAVGPWLWERADVASLGRLEAVPPGLELVSFKDAKEVTKAWGAEHWLYREGESPFSFKFIELKAGFRTSLQYHREKDEAYFLLTGEAILHYSETIGGPVHQVPFPQGLLAFVEPGTVHRVEAVTDVIIVEASTPDDGTDNVRIEDDWNRASGRIASEHT